MTTQGNGTGEDTALEVRPVAGHIGAEVTGTETLTVTAEHVPDDPNDPRKDTRPENNARQVVVNVSPDKAKVLLVDGEIRWEFHYLHTALVRDEAIKAERHK